MVDSKVTLTMWTIKTCESVGRCSNYALSKVHSLNLLQTEMSFSEWEAEYGKNKTSMKTIGSREEINIKWKLEPVLWSYYCVYQGDILNVPNLKPRQVQKRERDKKKREHRDIICSNTSVPSREWKCSSACSSSRDTHWGCLVLDMKEIKSLKVHLI